MVPITVWRATSDQLVDIPCADLFAPAMVRNLGGRSFADGQLNAHRRYEVEL